MVVKIVSFLTVVAVASAVVVQGPAHAHNAQLAAPVQYAAAPVQYAAAPVQYAAAPVQYAAAPVQYTAAPAAKLIYAEPEAPAQYEYEYSVADPQTGDDKSAKENRNGDNVQGYYTIVQPDGVRRIVEYTSSKEHGFNAVVRYEGGPVAAKVLAPAPVAYAPAQVAKVAYAQPPVAYAPTQVAKVAYAQAPVAYAPVAKVAYAPAQVAKVAYEPSPAQVNYAQPIAKYAFAPAPVAYAQPVTKVAYSPAASVGHVTYASPAVSYQH